MSTLKPERESEGFITDSEGNQQRVFWGVYVPFAIFPSGIAASYDDDEGNRRGLGYVAANHFEEIVTTNPERIAELLKQVVLIINATMDRLFGIPLGHEPDIPQAEQNLIDIVKIRLVVENDRFKSVGPG